MTEEEPGRLVIADVACVGERAPNHAGLTDSNASQIAYENVRPERLTDMLQQLFCDNMVAR